MKPGIEEKKSVDSSLDSDELKVSDTEGVLN